MSLPEPMELARRCVVGLVLAVLAAGIVLALLVPFHATDSLAYGEWSKRIAQTGDFHFPTIGNGFLSRPLVYFTQGWTWRILGTHEWLGRLESLAFGVLLIGAVARLAGGLRTVPGALAAAALVATPTAVQNLLSGQTDVPVAALLAAAACVLWTGERRGASRAGALVVVALLAVLAKNAALPALAGLGAAHLLGSRTGLRQRIVTGVLPLAAGGLLGLGYDAWQAHSVGAGSLGGFLTDAASARPGGPAGMMVRYAVGPAAGPSRAETLVALQWLGPFLTLTLGFGFAYAGGRVAGLGQRATGALATVVAVALAWLGPLVTGLPGPWESLTVALPSLLLIPALGSAAACPERQAVSRLVCARHLVWLLPTLVAWAFKAPDDVRLLAPAWPAAIVLLALSVATAMRGLERRSSPAAALVLVVMAGVALYDTRNLDSFGTRADGSANAWSAALHTRPADWGDPGRMRRAADPELGAVLSATRRAIGAHGRVFTSDARLRFFFLDRVQRSLVARCEDLRSVQAFLYVPNPAIRPASVWARCRSPRLREIATGPSGFVLFSVGPSG